ncbi:MAG: Rpn family recombination-promoting nuclease/putative transposase [Acidobacteria bacterium]|jgi:predicted transposase/invertase (TIGR01784 family)|nr:Rpn family recombination-promoting nuclease/putative transposase [Acidobacteriota bacterium]
MKKMPQVKKTATVKNAKNRKLDSAWKEIIRKLFKDFLEFFFVDIYKAIDFTKDIIFLDKDLKEIEIDSNHGDRVADVLVKVHLKDGSIKYICIIIHIEVQSQPRPEFMERMFIYYYRAFDKEKKDKIPVISLAILADDQESYRPDEYSFSFCGFELRMKIPIVKILDYKLKKEFKEKLETSTNPMTMVVNAQLKNHDVQGTDNEKKFTVTKELIRHCYKNGYTREVTHIIMKFFEQVIRLPGVYDNRIKEVIDKAEEEYKMDYIPSWERSAHRKGIREGMERGIERGFERGFGQGKRETAIKMLNKGYDIDVVCEMTGLDREEVIRLSENEVTTH